MFASTLLGDKQLLSDNVFDLSAFRLGRETSKEVSTDNVTLPQDKRNLSCPSVNALLTCTAELRSGRALIFHTERFEKGLLRNR